MFWRVKGFGAVPRDLLLNEALGASRILYGLRGLLCLDIEDIESAWTVLLLIGPTVACSRSGEAIRELEAPRWIIIIALFL